MSDLLLCARRVRAVRRPGGSGVLVILGLSRGGTQVLPGGVTMLCIVLCPRPPAAWSVGVSSVLARSRIVGSGFVPAGLGRRSLSGACFRRVSGAGALPCVGPRSEGFPFRSGGSGAGGLGWFGGVALRASLHRPPCCRVPRVGFCVGPHG